MAHVVHGSAGVQTKGYPTEGDTVEYSKSTGYKMPQERPQSCYHGKCKCEKNCNGTSTHHTATVTRVACFMDNSTEVYTDAGHMLMWEYPHGDACF
jgi:hypothetical protein